MDDLIQRAFLVDENVMARMNKRRRMSRKDNVGGSSKPRAPGQKRSKTPQVRNCDVCGLAPACHKPKMEVFGTGELGIMIVGEAPGDVEDRKGRPFIGPSGNLLSTTLSNSLVVMDKDCWLTNAIQCRLPGANKKKAKMDFHADCCQSRLELQIAERKPLLIIAFGAPAMRAVLRPSFADPSSTQYHGLMIPSRKHNCWVGCCWHPSFVLREVDKGNDNISRLFDETIKRFIENYAKPLPPPLPENHVVLNDFEAAKEFLVGMRDCHWPVMFDFETTQLSPIGPDARILCCSFAMSPEEGFWLPLQYLNYWKPEQLVELMGLLGEWIASSCPKVIQNRSMEEKWSLEFFQTPIVNCVNDTMVTHHCIYNRQKTSGLEFQTFMYHGTDHKNAVDCQQDRWWEKYTPEQICRYSVFDSQHTCSAHWEQQKILDREMSLTKASKFFNRCLPTLVRMESRGFAVDKDLLAKQRKDAEDKQTKCGAMLAASPFVEKFKVKFEKKSWGPGSDKDFIDLVYRTLDITPPPWTTEGGGIPSDKDAVAYILKTNKDEALKTFLDTTLAWRRYDTLLSTFIGGFEKALQPDGRIHPSFLLHTVASYRSSSSNPNLQNLPKRAAEHSEFRKVVIPSIGTLITEVDASGSEVVTIAMMSGDPILGKQVKEKFDPHRYWAAKLWEWDDPSKVTKQQRFLAKNKFVFPEFYGSYYKTCAVDLELPEAHVKRVEDEFWKMYAVAKVWQETLVKSYYKYGYVEFPMGFRRYAPLSKNQIINTPVQGTSFHMLLESVRAADEAMIAKGMRSQIELEVHDSIVTDVVVEELEDVQKIQIAEMSRQQWDWQRDIPRSAEFLMGPNWGEQKEVKV